MEALIKKRSYLKGKITSLKKKIDGHATSPLEMSMIKLYIEQAHQLKEKNDALGEEIFELCDNVAEEEAANQVHEEYDTRLMEILSTLYNLRDASAGPSPSTSTTLSNSSIAGGSAAVPDPPKERLPNLGLPTFSGDRNSWMSFHDLFRAIIHNNSKLSGAQKLQYLKNQVKGEPSSLIQNYQITDGNYDLAWKALESRYQDTRELMKINFDRLLSQANVTDHPLALQKLTDTTRECVELIRNLQTPAEAVGDLLIIHIIAKKLDSDSREHWVRRLKKDEIPTVDQFLEFLHDQSRIVSECRASESKRTRPERRKETMVHHGAATSTSKSSYQKFGCPYCNENHNIFNCQSFKSLSVEERWKSVRSKNLCFNCLQKSHRTDQCPGRCCKMCSKKHHTLLHRVAQRDPHWVAQGETRRDNPPEVTVEEPIASHFASQGSKTPVLLSTALIRVEDNTGCHHVCRALLDNGSQASFVTSRCATRLGLRRHKVDVPLTGLATTSAGTSKEAVKLNFSSCYASATTFQVNALVLKTVTSNMPTFSMAPTAWAHLEGLQLADPRYFEMGSIDILLGGDIFLRLIRNGIIHGPTGAPSSINTELGWIVGGETSRPSPVPAPLVAHHVQCDMDALLQKFWELEAIPNKRILTPEEEACETHFQATHTRDADGRFVVRLPFKPDAKPLGNSWNAAIRRLKSLERRHASNPEQHKKYQEVIEGYITLNHMELVPEPDIATTMYYMPHHAVVKESSTTTQLRVVFDGSQDSDTGVSLNERMMVGPKLQDDLVSILIRFRKHKFAFTADIAKMYRQIRMHKDDVDYQRIVWRNSPSEPIKNYRLLTATFGTSAAPYLAVKSLQQLAIVEESRHPEASAIVREDFYVDDLMSGASTEEEAVHLQQELTTLLGRGCMELRKWSSNSSSLISNLPESLREANVPLTIDTDSSVKTLGLQWHSAADQFSFRVVVSQSTSCTKRTILSEVAKVFDPLGWLSPVIIKAKILIQQLWRAGLDWDAATPPGLQEVWMQYRNKLPTIANVRIPRRVSADNSTTLQLHGFCDASESAYAAVVFLRNVNEQGEVTTNMIAAKSKVAPVKQVSLPRLELCGAVLLVNLMEYVQESLKLPIDQVHAWTDSTIVLAWLASPSQRWKTFVANRVTEIQQVVPSESWSHVRSEDNPADCASRGIDPDDLLNHQLWWNGPSWLSQINLPIANPDLKDVSPPEERTAIKILQVTEKDSLMYRYSTLSRLLRVTVYWYRCCVTHLSDDKQKLTVRATASTSATLDTKGKESRLSYLTFREMTRSPPTPKELDMALLRWIRKVQLEEFSCEFESLVKKQEVGASSTLRMLSPFVDQSGLLRVGGRLNKSNIHNDAKHQILLPKKHHLTQLIISHYHHKDLHTGPQALLAALQQRFWIPSGRDVVRHFVRKCVRCSRVRVQGLQQRMGDLPASRVTPAIPFQRCGVDYAGPFQTTVRAGRGQKSFKSYVALFICLVTRAIHLELVTDLTTAAFLAALRRFVSRRGQPTDIYSDCGTNFVGAKRQLEEYQQLVTSAHHQQEVQRRLAEDSITWHLNPPAAPHFGGLWEAGVKSMKFHLYRVVGTTILTGEEMQTLLTQVEACLNSRPMTEQSTDPNDLLPLTPGHFLIGRPLTALAEPDITHLKEGHLSRWQRVQYMCQHFWRRWTTEYLSKLQQRTKWLKIEDNIKIGSIVIIRDENIHPTKWNLGRILETHPGSDGLVRVVKLQTANGELTRPITKICILPVDV